MIFEHQKIKDIYSLSVDYNPALESTKDFFAFVQNKLLYAVTGQTAADLNRIVTMFLAHERLG